jgi:hypothetical protein
MTHTLEGSFMSIHAPSISIPVLGLYNDLNSEVQYLLFKVRFRRQGCVRTRKRTVESWDGTSLQNIGTRI